MTFYPGTPAPGYPTPISPPQKTELGLETNQLNAYTQNRVPAVLTLLPRGSCAYPQLDLPPRQLWP